MAAVKDPRFLLGNATVMLAPYTENVFALTPEEHSIGMVKAVTAVEESEQIQLKNGISQAVVDSVKSNVSLPISLEAYEFNAQNIKYALGLKGSVVRRLRGELTADVASAATSLSLKSYPIPGQADSLIDAVSDIPVGSKLLLQKSGETDFVYAVTTTGVATEAAEVYSMDIEAIPNGVSFSTGDTVWVVNEIQTGFTFQDDLFCAKLVGTLSANNEPAVMHIPKLKITKGFNLSFNETDHSNMPFELTSMLMSRSELVGRPSNYSDFEQALAKTYIGG